MDKIEIDFAKSMNDARQLEELAASYGKLANTEYAEIMQTVSVNWKSDNANEYLRKATLLRTNMTGTANALKAVAASIRSTAKRIYDAEMNAKRLAEERTSRS